jgi:uncharacterized protein YbjQ (UPF0145 family)
MGIDSEVTSQFTDVDFLEAMLEWVVSAPSEEVYTLGLLSGTYSEKKPIVYTKLLHKIRPQWPIEVCSKLVQGSYFYKITSCVNDVFQSASVKYSSSLYRARSETEKEREEHHKEQMCAIGKSVAVELFEQVGRMLQEQRERSKEIKRTTEEEWYKAKKKAIAKMSPQGAAVGATSGGIRQDQRGCDTQTENSSGRVFAVEGISSRV